MESNFDRIATLVRGALAITVAKRMLGLLSKGTHDPDRFIRPAELSAAVDRAGLVFDPMIGLGPRGINRCGDFIFGTLPLRTLIYMGVARKLGKE